jgi:hypothetical protein
MNSGSSLLLVNGLAISRTGYARKSCSIPCRLVVFLLFWGRQIQRVLPCAIVDLARLVHRIRHENGWLASRHLAIHVLDEASVVDTYMRRFVRRIPWRLPAGIKKQRRVCVVNAVPDPLLPLGLDFLTFLAATVLVIPVFKSVKASPVLGFLFSGLVLGQLGCAYSLASGHLCEALFA